MHIKTPKQFLIVCGKPILIHTIERFQESEQIDRIVVVTLRRYVSKVESLVREFHLGKVCKVLEGGSTAFESQIKGIEYVYSQSSNGDDIVLIHDGVRPLVDSSLINECVQKTVECGNAVTVTPTVETTAIVQGNGEIAQTFPRERCVIVRAPQVFRLSSVYAYHQKALREEKTYIDTASMFLDNGQRLYPIVGPVENIKVTTKFDYLLLKKIIGSRK